MASKTMFALNALRPGRVVVFGSFVPNGGSAIDNTQNEGSGGSGTGIWSVARTATGQYTVTFNDKYALVETGDASLQSTTAQQAAFQTVSKSQQSIVYGAVVAGAFADIAAAAGSRIHFMAVLRNTPVV
jgi:hypothetical protein